jgi:hypothetical protein
MQDANWRTAVRANQEIALYAGEFSHHFLTGTFLSLFHVERSCELAEPELFSVDTAPNRLETRRMSAAHWLYFTQSLLNEELLARRSVAEQEYEFVLILDVSRSLTAGWFDALAHGSWEQHPCYRLKYLAYALLVSAFREGFKCRVVVFDQGGARQWEAKDDETFAFAVLERIDELILERGAASDRLWPWEATLQDLIDTPNQLLACVVSDFLDAVQGHVDQEEFLSLFTELRYANRLVVLQVNHRRDVTLSVGGEGLSTNELHYGEDGDHRGLSAAAIQEYRLASQEWLGGLEEGTGRFGQRLAEERIPLQRFLQGNDIDQRFEELAYLILQE